MTTIDSIPVLFPDLKELMISNTLVSALPAQLLTLSQLETLKVANSPLSELQAVDLPSLKVFDIANTQITQLPEQIDLPSIEQLRIN